MPDVAIVADDLTGALDAAAPFAMRGRRVEAIVDWQALEDLETDVDVVTVNAATRARSADAAAKIVHEIGVRLGGLEPRLLFKKIDSTLRGHIAPELKALTVSSGRHRAIVCPAVPAQGRVVRSGLLVVRGAGKAYGRTANADEIAPLFEEMGSGGDLQICDASDKDDLREAADRVLERPDETVAVGAAGLAEALAERLFGPAQRNVVPLSAPGLFVVGSRAVVTRHQLRELHGDPRAVTISVDLTNESARAAGPGSQIEVLAPDQECIPSDVTELAVADRIAEIAIARFEALKPDTLFLCGGHIAERVLAAFPTSRLSIVGEIEPGVPVSRARIRSHLTSVVTKAGGFGDPEFLSRLAERVAVAP